LCSVTATALQQRDITENIAGVKGISIWREYDISLKELSRLLRLTQKGDTVFRGILVSLHYVSLNKRPAFFSPKK
jgi:hypothetical protein